MAESVVSFVLEQLSVLLREEKQLLGGLDQEIEYIQDEMMQMREFLKVADVNEERDPSLKEWVRQLREISYDVQDVLDEYMRLSRRNTGTNTFSTCMKSVYSSITNLKSRHQIASEIQAIKNRLENVSRSKKRYTEIYPYAVMDQGSRSASFPEYEWYDGRGDALLLDEDDIVGFEKPKKRLLEWIGSMENGLEVISVVGMGGLGKTTLVKKVYDDESVKRHFNQLVWIVASDYTDVNHLLANLIKKLIGEVKKWPVQGLKDMSIDEMKSFIYEFLHQKNYMIVLDDVLDISRWEAIKFALPKRGVHGCVIITTRFISIASAACSETNHVYNLEPLPREESRELFYKKAFPRNPCPPYLGELADNILNRCEGLPLAIVVIGGLLATKKNKAEEWESFNRSLSYELEVGNLPRLSRLLSFSYKDLPCHLKYCFLYLSICPENGVLEKGKIIRLWVAEGLVQSKQEKTVEEVAEDYLNQLASRSLIQAAEVRSDGRVKAFRMHDLLREYVTAKSSEQNIVAVSNGGEMQWPNKMRRLAIMKSVDFSNSFKYLRSLLLVCKGDLVDSGQIKQLISKCRLLKVLDLRGAPLETIPDEVFKLYHLKYLCLRNTMVKVIPKSIKYLENLETLDLKNCNVTEVPIEILKLRKLRHFIAYKYQKMYSYMFGRCQSVKAPTGIGGSFLSLQKLFCIHADEVDGIKIVREIEKLTQLRKLGITNLRNEDGKDLCSSIAKLTNLRSLRIHSAMEDEKLDLDYSLSCASLPFLRTVVLYGCLDKIPQWILSLNGLTTLSLMWSKLREDPLACLQDLPNLIWLKVHNAYVEGLSFKARGFQKLKVLYLLESPSLKWVIVEKGSIPFLQWWTMANCKLVTELPQGIEHLTNLQSVRFGNMGNEFVDRVAVEKKNEGDNWKLARVPLVGFYNVIDGAWNELHV